MEVNVVAGVILTESSYYGRNLMIEYKYRIEGGKAKRGSIKLIYQDNESHNAYISRIRDRLEYLTVDEVTLMVKEQITTEIKKSLEYESNEEFIKSKLKELNKINFSFEFKKEPKWLD